MADRITVGKVPPFHTYILWERKGPMCRSKLATMGEKLRGSLTTTLARVLLFNKVPHFYIILLMVSKPREFIRNTQEL